MTASRKIDVTVAEVIEVNDLVKRFRFERTDGAPMPAFSGGAHTVIEMRDGEVTRLNPYSLMSDPHDLSGFMISVRRDEAGRGGSLFMHRTVNAGDRMVLSMPVNLFPLDHRAKKHLMIAGGIGITPFIAQMQQLGATDGHFELHYSVRSAAIGAYAEDLAAQYPGHVRLYLNDMGQKIDLDALLTGQPLGTHLYVCGPKGMIDWVRDTARGLGWPDATVHHEEFLAPQPGKPFEVTLARSGRTLTVGENQSFLEALEAAGLEPPYLCRGGACGQCETDVLSHEGTFLHRDHWLTDEEKAGGRKIMPCVSRFEGPSLVIDR